MLQNAHAYTKLPVSDPQRARKFYVEVLGLTPEWEKDGHVWFNHTDGSGLLIFPVAGRHPAITISVGESQTISRRR